MPQYGQYYEYDPYDLLPSGREHYRTSLSDIEGDDEQRQPYRGRDAQRANQRPQPRRTADPTQPPQFELPDPNQPGYNYLADVWRWINQDRGASRYTDPRLRGYSNPDYAAPEMPPSAATAMPSRPPAPPVAAAQDPRALADSYQQYQASRGAMMVPPGAAVAGAGARRAGPRGGWAAPGGAAPVMTPPPMAATGPDGDTAGLRFIAPNSVPESGPAPAPPSRAQTVLDELMADKANDKRNLWMALARGGFGAAAGSSPYWGVNFGKGGAEAVDTYSDLTQRDAQQRLRAATLQLQSEQAAERAGLERKRVGYQGDELQLRREDLGERRNERADERSRKERELDLKAKENESQGRLRDKQGNYYDATARDISQGRADDRRSRQEAADLDKMEDNARQYADSRFPKSSLTGERPEGWEAAYRSRLRELKQSRGKGGNEPAGFAPVGTVIRNPSTGERLRSTGTAWEKAP